MAQLRGISRTTRDAPPHSEDKHGPGRRAYRGITNRFDIVASPLGKGERMKVRGLNCTSQLANVFETLPPLSLAREKRLVSCMTFNRPNIRTDNLALSVYKN